MNPIALTLYVDSSFSSPYAMSAFVALVEKQLPFTTQVLDLHAGQTRQTPYVDMAPTARVPALVHGDFVLTESSAISEYLEEAFTPPAYAALFPRGLRQRALARQVQAWLRSDLLALRDERSTATIFAAPITTPLSEAARSAADKLLQIANRLVTGAHLFEQWCIADADLALMLNRLVMSGEAVPDKLREYAASQWQRPSIGQWLALKRR